MKYNSYDSTLVTTYTNVKWNVEIFYLATFPFPTF